MIDDRSCIDCSCIVVCSITCAVVFLKRCFQSLETFSDANTKLLLRVPVASILPTICYPTRIVQFIPNCPISQLLLPCKKPTRELLQSLVEERCALICHQKMRHIVHGIQSTSSLLMDSNCTSLLPTIVIPSLLTIVIPSLLSLFAPSPWIGLFAPSPSIDQWIAVAMFLVDVLEYLISQCPCNVSRLN